MRAEWSKDQYDFVSNNTTEIPAVGLLQIQNGKVRFGVVFSSFPVSLSNSTTQFKIKCILEGGLKVPTDPVDPVMPFMVQK